MSTMSSGAEPTASSLLMWLGDQPTALKAAANRSWLFVFPAVVTERCSTMSAPCGDLMNLACSALSTGSLRCPAARLPPLF